MALSPLQSKNMQVVFVSNPLCSWCWGMEPEIQKFQQQFPDLTLRLRLGALGFDQNRVLTEAGKAHLQQLWRRVSETTAQIFSGSLPADFVYNSLPACRAVCAVRKSLPDSTLDYLSILQQCFFVQGEDINRTSVQIAAASEVGLGEKLFEEALEAVEPESVIEECDSTRSSGGNALPSVFVQTSDSSLHLIAGGYITAEFLAEAIVPYSQSANS